MTAEPVAVLTAIPETEVEARLVTGLGPGRGAVVVRRCIDLADLLAVAAAGLGRVAVVSASLRRLDRDAVATLAASGVAVVGLAESEEGERRLRQLGVMAVLPLAASAEQVAGAVGTALTGASPPLEEAPVAAVAEPASDGRVISVWGPAGAPGRTTVALGLAAELAVLGVETMLIDADVYGGSVAQLLGFLEEAPGLAAACRLANAGELDPPRLAGLARQVRPGLRVLPGIARPARWPELRPAAFETVLELARGLAAVTVVDCGFSLEQDEELLFDTSAPQRNGATFAALAAADTVLAVGSADPVSVQRLVRGLSDVRDAVPGCTPVVVVNRARRGAVGGDPVDAVGAALRRHAGVVPAAYVPLDVAGVDAALASGRTLAEAAPGSPARRALTDLAAALAGLPAPGRSRFRRRARLA